MKKTLLLFALLSALYSVKASDTLTIRQVFNFEIGDTLDYKYRSSVNAGPASSYSEGYFRYLILSKAFSPDSETVTYTRSILYPAGGIVDTAFYSSLDSSIIFTDTMQYGSSGYQFSSALDTNNFQTNTSHFITTDLGTTRIFTSGLGLTYSKYAWGNATEAYGYNDTTLIYYSRGNIQRGRPYYQYQRVDIISIPGGQEIYLYPNPSNEFIHLSFRPSDQNPASLILTDLLGQQVYSSTISETETTHDITSLSSGIYTWRIVSDNTILKTGKVVKQ